MNDNQKEIPLYHFSLKFPGHGTAQLEALRSELVESGILHPSQRAQKFFASVDAERAENLGTKYPAVRIAEYKPEQLTRPFFQPRIADLQTPAPRK